MFVGMDFDGTISKVDVTDAILQKFAPPEWLVIEELWEKGEIGSRECLARQMALIKVPLMELVNFVEGISIDKTFSQFITFLKQEQISFGIISDGFNVFVQEILANAGIKDVPVYANGLREQHGKLETYFPHAKSNCPAGTCKCAVRHSISCSSPFVFIGDGRSDFCIAENADFVFAKGKLEKYCLAKEIPHINFTDFSEIQKMLLPVLSIDPYISFGG